ncbi:MAG TPA: hypothetical protein VGL38_00330 [bacterium]|jgi:hypothetical protein
MLGLFHGVACLLDPEGSIQSAGENWDDLLGRTGRPDLLRNAILGKPFLELLPGGDEPRTSFCFALASLAEGKQRQLVQAADYGSAGRPFTLTWVFHPLTEGDKLSGYVVQGIDTTQETVIRMALLDRERRLRELKAMCERQNDEIGGLKKRLEGRIAGHDDAISNLLQAFERDPQAFREDLCRLATETSGAMFATLAAFSPAKNGFHFTAHHAAPDFHRFAIGADAFELEAGEGPAGIAVQNGCATKFDHLPEREDFAKWAPLAREYGYNCIWALPLDDASGLYGALQLFFPEQDKPLSVEQYATLAAMCQHAVPLLRASDAWRSRVVAEPQAASAENKPDSLRALAAGLSEEFGNLLTGVLGHSSLAVAEIGDSHAALNDIHAIERAARNAARLTRRLSAICGTARRASTPLDLNHYLKQYVERDRANFFGDGPAQLALPGISCPARVDVGTVEVMLDGMAEHARMVMSGGTPAWTLTTTEDTLTLTLTYEGNTSVPVGWNDGGVPTHSHAPIPELLFAREAARVLGGELTFGEDGMTASLTLSLPLVKAAVQA